MAEAEHQATSSPDGRDSHGHGSAHGSWRSGRPSRRAREAVEALLPEEERSRYRQTDEPGFIEGLVRERSLHDLFDGRADEDADSDADS